MSVDIQYPEISHIHATATDPHRTFFTIHHTLVQGANPMMFYYRDISATIIDALGTYRLTVITGSPGCGKSLTVWLYVLLLAQHYAHLRIIWIDDTAGKMYLLHNHQVTFLDNFLDVTSMIHIEDHDIVVVDQISSNENYLAHLRKVYRDITKLIMVTSMKLNLKQSVLDTFRSKVVTVTPWTLEDYKNACDSPAFFQTVLVSLGVNPPPAPAFPLPIFADAGPGGAPTIADYIANKPMRDALVEDKYYYAGFSCRYMFGPLYYVSRLCTHLSNAIAVIPNMADAMNGNVSDDISNSLFVDVYANGVATILVLPVSEYAMKVMTRKLNGVNFAVVSDLASLNAALNGDLDGHIFKMDVNRAVTNNNLCKRIKFVVAQSARRWAIAKQHPHTQYFVNTRMVEFHRVLQQTTPLQVYDPNTWFFPKTTCQGGFDLVQLYISTTAQGVATNVLRFIQVTRADTYDLRLDFMASFANSFNAGRIATSTPPQVNTFEVMIMTTTEKAVYYKYNPPTHVMITGLLPGWDIGQLQVTAFKRAHER